MTIQPFFDRPVASDREGAGETGYSIRCYYSFHALPRSFINQEWTERGEVKQEGMLAPISLIATWSPGSWGGMGVTETLGRHKPRGAPEARWPLIQQHLLSTWMQFWKLAMGIQHQVETRSFLHGGAYILVLGTDAK